MPNPGWNRSDRRAYARQQQDQHSVELWKRRKEFCLQVHPFKYQVPQLFVVTENRCWICLLPLTIGQQQWQVEHVFPLGNSGHHVLPNLLPAHKECNKKKNGSSPWKFAASTTQRHWVKQAQAACTEATNLHRLWMQENRSSLVEEVEYHGAAQLVHENSPFRNRRSQLGMVGPSFRGRR